MNKKIIKYYVKKFLVYTIFIICIILISPKIVDKISELKNKDNEIKQIQSHTNTLPGYTLETNGEEWRWVGKSGNISILYENTRAKTINDAWVHYNYNYDNKSSWITAE